MTKVAYNSCFGGFSLSRAAVLRAREISGNPQWGGNTIKGDQYTDEDYGFIEDVPRHDDVLVRVIEELRGAADGYCARLAIANIPDGSSYRIDEYDGKETVMTPDDYEWIKP